MRALPTRLRINRSPTFLILLILSIAACRLSPGTPGEQPGPAQTPIEVSGVNGGLVVHLGCGDGRLTAALRAGDAYLVHGLDTDAGDVAKARTWIQDQGLYGPVSVDVLGSGRLPYVDNLVNLLVVSDDCGVAREEMERALAPNGVLLPLDGPAKSRSVAGGKPKAPYVKWAKPFPPEYDDWSHYLHEADGNAVGQDKQFGPSRYAQWMNGPMKTRHHEYMSSLSAMVSDQGRFFYIFDEAPVARIGFHSEWFLTARDAFNGLTLWKRPIDKWHDQTQGLKTGPATLPRRLVATGGRVFVTLGIDAPVSVLDARTGSALFVLPDSESTEEIIISDGVVLCTGGKTPNTGAPFRRWKVEPWFLKAYRADTGQALWSIETPMYRLSLAADEKGVYFCDGERLIALERETGKPFWQSDPVVLCKTGPASGYGATLVVHDGVVLFDGGTDQSAVATYSGISKAAAFEAATGKKLWEAESPASGHATPKDIFAINDVVYLGDTAVPSGKGYFGLDLGTGKPVRSLLVDSDKVLFNHQRCYRARATGDFILSARTGTELVDVNSGEWVFQDWLRGACIYGIMPSYEMLYITPQPCACFLDHKLEGFAALRSQNELAAKAIARPGSGRLERSGSNAKMAKVKVDVPPQPVGHNAPSAAAQDWPTFRHDNSRGGATQMVLPDKLDIAWQAEAGTKISAPTIAEGKLFVADIDGHAIRAIDISNGQVLWSFTAGGRIDSAPTVHEGLALFGCRDGYVYALSTADGQLIWRFRAAPADLRICAYGQVESLWPTHGSVLIEDGLLYVVAGRSMFLDGGLRLLVLDPGTGSLKHEVVWDHTHANQRFPAIGHSEEHNSRMTKRSALPDILSSDGKDLFMRALRFSKQDGRIRSILEEGASSATYTDFSEMQKLAPHLFSPMGFLDDTWFHRSPWSYGTVFAGGAIGWHNNGKVMPSGRILCVDNENIYGYGRKPEYYRWSGTLQYRLYRAPKDWKIKTDNPRMRVLVQVGSEFLTDWSVDVPIHIRAMVKAGDRLYVAGPPDPSPEGEPTWPQGGVLSPEKARKARDAWEGKYGAQLLVLDAGDGRILDTLPLDTLPVFDGLAAADGRLFVSMNDGSVRCLAGE